MPLIPNLKACVADKCTKLILTDATGLYHATTNAGGWGAPNPTGSGDGGFVATYSLDGGTAVSVATYVANPVAIAEFSLGEYAHTLADGWHTITYSITTTAAGTTTGTTKIFTYCNIKCCVFSKMLEMKTLDLCKDVEKLASYMHLWTLYKSLIYAANGCNADEAKDILSRLNKLCPAAATGGCGCS
tara:strand:+ start:181 stop:741 length:561 start_codon:yes stop_codon:yes gene_type:complete